MPAATASYEAYRSGSPAGGRACHAESPDVVPNMTRITAARKGPWGNV